MKILAKLLGVFFLIGVTSCNLPVENVDIFGVYNVEKSIIAISDISGPTEDTRLVLNSDGSFLATLWPAWTLVPLTGNTSIRLISEIQGPWSLQSDGKVEFQFSSSEILPSGAVLLVSLRRDKKFKLKVPLNPGNKDDFMILVKASSN